MEQTLNEKILEYLCESPNLQCANDYKPCNCGTSYNCPNYIGTANEIEKLILSEIEKAFNAGYSHRLHIEHKYENGYWAMNKEQYLKSLK
jgi:hypothetical protein